MPYKSKLSLRSPGIRPRGTKRSETFTKRVGHQAEALNGLRTALERAGIK